MQVGSQYLIPGTFSKHLVVRSRKAGARKRAILAALSLTSMVDMFSLLVIFLLQTFSASPEMMAVTKGVTLPQAVSGVELKDAPILSLAQDGVYLDQKFVGKIDDLLRNPEPLMKRLEGLRELWQRTHPAGKFPGEVNLQAHQDISSTVVSQFMGMLPSQAFGSIQLAVISGGGGT